MSLILDALKKSEQERRRERGPDLQSIHRPVVAVASPAGRNWWLLGAAVVLLNGAGVAWWLLHADGSSDVATTVAATTASIPQLDTAQAGSTASVPPAVSADPASVQPVPVTPSASAPPPAGTATKPNTATESDFMPITPGGAAVPSAPVQELWELPETVRRNLPPMTYSFHVYAGDPQRRTIIINNRRLREGEQVADGLVLEEITQDGVILATGGYRVHIAVLGDW